LTTQILALDEIQDDSQGVGGKARGLARLRRMGLRVPEAFVLVAPLDHGLPPDLDARTARLPGEAVAVRSSALGEDGAATSFAGQYETVLDVRGSEALHAAIETCLASVESQRAAAYRESRHSPGAAVMSIVIQQMIDAKASGVCFTADPVTNRRQRLVLDAVRGLGEALVSGHAAADHDELQRATARWEPRQRTGAEPVLSPVERAQIAREALEAEAKAGEPLDLEWAIDQDGTLFWLQARPITTLALDPQELDTAPPRPEDVFTRCNAGEMMPGAISPLTSSTCARGIDIGWQDNLIRLGLRQSRSPENVYIGISHGHIFINLSEGARFAAAVTGTGPDQQSLAICGRRIPEVAAPPPPPLWVRLPRALKQLAWVVRAKPKLRAMERLVEGGSIRLASDSRATWRNIDAKLPELYESYRLHLIVSSGAGALAPILLGLLAGKDEPSPAHHAAVAHLLAGAQNVESADIAQGAERVLDHVLATPGAKDFAELGYDDALAWLRGPASGEGGRAFGDYLSRHGHRSLRELDVRQPEWASDPSPLVQSLQTQVRGRLRHGGVAPKAASPASQAPAELARIQRFAGIAHAAVRNRERSKSLLVSQTVHFKRAYRELARQLVSEARLPDVDALFFLLHEELETLANEEPGSPLVALALSRRSALRYQESLRFPEVAVGVPQPEPPQEFSGDDRWVLGKPVSRGQVEGRVRVVLDLAGAQALEPGEILVAPITDVGWTPYFAILAGLVTDVGSAVSHGAVVAREYGLPAVLNTGDATRRLRTGQRIRLDGDRGRVEILDPHS
jgi:pyruvate,water dikinase